MSKLEHRLRYFFLVEQLAAISRRWAEMEENHGKQGLEELVNSILDKMLEHRKHF